ncbi:MULTISPECIES: hypothetical protein [unclassified Frankia]|uniref:hypothetical protein n=1 Tax=unclassified Frankia TaxID=2632575 RepID=UPI002AD47850|nr:MULTISPECIES: hypothetical protein [unclassified Frankia]
MDGDGHDDGWTCDVGVALVDRDSTGDADADTGDDGESWLVEAAGRGGQHRRTRRAAVVERGEEAVRAAVRALSSQIGVVAGEVARGLDGQGLVEAAPGRLGVDAVEVSFGVTLTAGSGQAIQAVLSVEGEAAVQVTVSLTRRPAAAVGA